MAALAAFMGTSGVALGGAMLVLEGSVPDTGTCAFARGWDVAPRARVEVILGGWVSPLAGEPGVNETSGAFRVPCRASRAPSVPFKGSSRVFTTTGGPFKRACRAFRGACRPVVEGWAPVLDDWRALGATGLPVRAPSGVVRGGALGVFARVLPGRGHGRVGLGARGRGWWACGWVPTNLLLGGRSADTTLRAT